MIFYDNNGVEHVLADRNAIILFENPNMNNDIRYSLVIPNWVTGGNSAILHVNQNTYLNLKRWVLGSKAINE